jgi:hypothetical protein
MEYLTEKRFDDFEDRLWNRFDKQDELSRKLGERVAVVEAQSNRSEQRLNTQTTDTRKTAAGWGAGVGTAVAAFAYTAFNLFFGKGQGQ